ncbi:MAG: hypothetical protein V1858_04185 [Candidatus Gottesmanbacteria bacterium]
MKPRDLPLVLSMIFALLVIPLTLAAIKVNQDVRSQAMVELPPLPTIPPLSSPSPTPR